MLPDVSSPTRPGGRLSYLRNLCLLPWTELRGSSVPPAIAGSHPPSGRTPHAPICPSAFNNSLGTTGAYGALQKGFSPTNSAEDPDFLPKSKLTHAPTKKLRMEVLKRDRVRCLICGRSPANNVDVELHLHHVIPWGVGGLTEEINLVTLCHTCHSGLDPHDDSFVRQLMAVGQEDPANYQERLLRYQQALLPGLKEKEGA